MSSKFSEILTNLILKTGKSKNKIERDLNYPRNSLTNYLYGKIPNAVRLSELADYFGVSMEALLGKDSKYIMKKMLINFNYLTAKDQEILIQEILNENRKGRKV